MKKLTWTIALTLLACFVIAAVLLFRGVSINGATVSLQFFSRAAEVLESLGLPEGAEAPSDIEVEGPDGPMPEIARRSFVVSGEDVLPRVRHFYSQQCREMGLSSPSEDQLAMEPNLICVKQGQEDIWVVFSSRCKEMRCDIFLKVHVI